MAIAGEEGQLHDFAERMDRTWGQIHTLFILKKIKPKGNQQLP